MAFYRTQTADSRKISRGLQPAGNSKAPPFIGGESRKKPQINTDRRGEKGMLLFIP
jgi:hypothetical protein